MIDGPDRKAQSLGRLPRIEEADSPSSNRLVFARHASSGTLLAGLPASETSSEIATFWYRGGRSGELPMTVRFVRKTIRHELMTRRAQTLEEGVLAAFPNARKEDLVAWLGGVAVERGREPEFLLFVALICGTQYRVIHPEAALVLERLRQWLTEIPKRLDPEVADVVIEALTPRVECVMRDRGWLEGAELQSIQVKGRPPETAGAWAAATLVERELSQSGVEEAQALKHATGLAQVLLGRAIAPNEFYRARVVFRMDRSATLVRELRQEYERILAEIIRRQHPEPAAAIEESLYPERRRQYRDLRYELAVVGCEVIARSVLRSIPADMWPPIQSISRPLPATGRSKSKSTSRKTGAPPARGRGR